MIVRIGLHGCDDSTYIDTEVSDAEKAFLDRIAALSEKESTYGCMPTMSVTVITRPEKTE